MGATIMDNTSAVMTKSIAAGIAIALGGYAYIHLEGGVIGALLFSIGLITVCIMNLNLYTGKICYILRDPKNPGLYIWILICNLVGVLMIAFIAPYGASKSAMKFVQQLSNNKLQRDMTGVFVSAFICNIFIYIAVNTWKNYKDIVGIAVIVLSVVGFITTGSEHCIADAFYFAVGGGPINKILLFMAVCIIGNTFGGIFAYLINREWG